MNNNLKQLIIDNNVAKVFKGNEADRQIWVRAALDEIVEANWKLFDDDNNGAMDLEESFNFL